MQTVNSEQWSSCLSSGKDTEQTRWCAGSQAVSCLWFWWISSSLLRQSILMKWITLIICHLASAVARHCPVHCARASLGRMVSLAAPECVWKWPWRNPLLRSELNRTLNEKLYGMFQHQRGSQSDSCCRISKPYTDAFDEDWGFSFNSNDKWENNYLSDVFIS